MLSRVDEVERRTVAVEVSNRDGSAIGTDRHRPHRPDDRAAIVELPIGLEASAYLVQCSRVEERNPAAVAAQDEQPPVARQRFVEDLVVGPADDGQRCRRAQQRRQQVAAGRSRVVQLDALAREQKGAIDLRLHERLCSEPFSHGGSRLLPGPPARLKRHQARGHGQ